MLHYRKLKIMLLMLLTCVIAKAQLEHGKVYNFVNVANSGQSMAMFSSDRISIKATDQSDYGQLWYVTQNSDDSYSLRNLSSGRYLRSSNGRSSLWTMVKEDNVDANCKFSCVSAGSGYTLRATNTEDGYHYMHYGVNNGGVVCWNMSADATLWTMNVVNVSDEELEANWNELALIDPNEVTMTTYNEALGNLFSDKACTTLKKSFTSENAVKADADYKKLPATLQQMVLKVYNNSWAEDNSDSSKPDWDASYAKKYRVQLYEPYNNAGAAAEALGLNAHTNLNNPTGIFSNNREALYVIVEGTIKEGSDLYLASYTGHGKLGNPYNEGVQLKEGLNVVPSFGDGINYCINYVVHTFDTEDGKRGNDAKARKLSDYAPLKIHIEGGYINGYWNKVGDDLYGEGDKNDDWDYIAARATQTDVTVLGKYITLQFPLNDADTEGNRGLGFYYTGKDIIEQSIDEWDKVMMWERIVLGVLDKETTEAEAKKSPYSDKPYVFEYTGDDTDGFESGYGDYYNVHGLSFGVGGDSYMYGSWDHCGYHYGTMQSVMVDILTSAGSHWGPGHEIGHQHQNLLTVNGLTEVTNNLFANIVLWYYGETTSRVNGDNGALSNVLAQYNTEGADFFSNNIWAQTHMYYKLFLYYHILGHNTKFYPKLFEMLRHEPMSAGYEQAGATTILHFYKKCCEAAGEDLTEFFRAYGFFEVMNKRLVGDYSNSEYTQSQKDIDEAIAYVKAKGYEENISVLFINDATGDEIVSHKGNTLALYDGNATAELGSYASFDEVANTGYTYSVSGNTVTMEGSGGVGFAIYNEKGEIIAFSDKKSFTVSNEVAASIAEGEVVFAVINSDNSVSVPMNIMASDDTSAKYAVLGELLASAQAIVDLSDNTGTKLGFYRTDAIAALIAAYNKAKTVYDNRIVASYSAVFDMLYREYVDVVNNEYARIGLVEGNVYRLVNKAYPELSMSINNSGMLGETTDESSDAQRWYFESSGTEGSYYLKNKSTQTYPGQAPWGSYVSSSATTTTDAHVYRLSDMGNGAWALVGGYSLHCSASQSNRIVGWESGANASQWYITSVESDQTAEALYNLQVLIEQTEALIDEVGSVDASGSTPLVLTESNYYCNAECKDTRYGDQFTSYSVLCDNNSGTFLHTDYSSQAPAEDHYIRIDVGSGNKLQMFNLNYRTRKEGNLCAPTKVVVEVSNDATSWLALCDITSGLPDTNDASHIFANLGNGVAYRYVRMRVYGNSTGQKANERFYFIVSELGLSRINYVETPNDAYASIASGKMLDAFNAALTAKGVIATTATGEYESAYNTLQAAYDALLAARDAVNETALNAKKTELQSLIDITNSLISELGTITLLQGAELPLSTTAGEGIYYLTDGPSEPKEGNLGNLLDDDVNTFYVSNWNAQNSHPYLQVQLPEGKELSEFVFTFTSRNNGNAPTPTIIIVSGSNDGITFTPIETFTKDTNEFPEPANGGSNKAVKWTSPRITSSTTYKYLRFTVTESDRSSGNETDSNGFYHFGISEFGLNSVDGYSVVLFDNADNVTETQLLEAYHELVSAQKVMIYGTTEYHLQKAIDKLQAKYNLLVATQEETITISSVGYSTLYLDYPVYIPEGVEIYVMSGIEGDYATLKRIEGVLPANNGVILRNAGTYTFKRATEPATPVESNLLSGTAETIATNSVDGVVYTLQKNENGGVVFRRYNGDNLNAKKAYLVLSDSSEAQALRIRFADEEVTSIDNAASENGVGLDIVYDLQGRRVVTPGKGVYIVNGKKMVIK